MSVLSHLREVAARLNIAERESVSIGRSISTLSDRLRVHFGTGIRQELQFGSSTRRTMLPREADARSDVDYMVVFDNDPGYKPQTFMSRLRLFAEKYYHRSDVFQSSPTVVLRLNHIKFDLVPAFRPSGLLWPGDLHIPAPASSFLEWMKTDPLDLNQPLQDKNRHHDFQIKPTIRLLKYWNAQSDYVYESYELERHLTGHAFWLASNLKEYVYAAVAGLPTSRLPGYKRSRVERLQAKVNEVKAYEAEDMPFTAAQKIAEIFPALG